MRALHSTIGTRRRGIPKELDVNQRAVFASKQRELLPTVLMPSLISSGLCNLSMVLIF